MMRPFPAWPFVSVLFVSVAAFAFTGAFGAPHAPEASGNTIAAVRARAHSEIAARDAEIARLHQQIAVLEAKLAQAPSAPNGSPSAMIYGRERLFTLNAADTAMLKSHYSTVTLFVVDVEPNGDLNYNGNHLIVQDGKYVGDPRWGARLAALKKSPTTVKRIEVCTGGAGARSWVNIRNLIASQGTGPGSILYRNFQAMQKTLGIDAIDNDDEIDFNISATVTFGNMLASLGMPLTLAPYNNQNYWALVKSQLGSKVDTVYLQCYDGGGGNDPAAWNPLFGGLKVQPGDWDVDSVATVQSKMAGWAAADGVTGGFFWLLDDRSPDEAGQYGDAILKGLAGTR